MNKKVQHPQGIALFSLYYSYISSYTLYLCCSTQFGFFSFLFLLLLPSSCLYAICSRFFHSCVLTCLYRNCNNKSRKPSLRKQDQQTLLHRRGITFWRFMPCLTMRTNECFGSDGAILLSQHCSLSHFCGEAEHLQQLRFRVFFPLHYLFL